jgi:hypothetical protein
LDIEENYLTKIKVKHSKHTADILSGEKWLKYPSKIRNKIMISLSLLLFTMVLDILARAFRQERETEVVQIGKEEVNCLFA